MTRTGVGPLFICLLVASGSGILGQDTPSTAPNIALEKSKRLAVFDKTWEIVNRRYFDVKFNGVDWRAARVKYRPLAEAAADKLQLHSVLQGMLSEMRTSHTFVNPGFFFGNGINVKRIDGSQIVRFVDAGSPAERAGIQPGWLITQWNGNCVTFRSVLTIALRDGEKNHAATVACGAYARKDSTVRTVQPLEPGAVYLRFDKFLGKADSWLASQVSAHASATTIVLDLRNNGGGDIQETFRALKLFFERDTPIGVFRFRNGSPAKATVDGSGPRAYRGRVLVMVGAEAGSAAEIFAAAMKESGRGTLVGRPTAGAMLLGRSHKLPHGFTLTIPEADYVTQHGQRIEGRGVTPDEQVTFTLRDHLEHRDPDLDRVRELVATNAAND